MKVAVAVGAARRFVVGDPEIQLIDVLAGRLIDELAAAEQHAGQGEVVLDQSALEPARRPRRDRRAARGRRTAGGRRRRRRAAAATRPPSRPSSRPSRCPRTSSGRGCCRPSTSGCAPAAASSSPSSGPRFRCSCASAASTTTTTTTRSRSSTTSSAAPSGLLAQYGGNLLQLTLGDKGAYLYAVFGVAARARGRRARAPSAAALELRELDRVTAAARPADRHRPRPAAQRHLRPRDAAHVRLPRRRGQPRRAADVGRRRRGRSTSSSVCEAPPATSFAWERLPPLAAEGQGGAGRRLRADSAATGHGSRRHRRHELPIVGRRDELAALVDARSTGRSSGRGRVVGDRGRGGHGQVAARRRVRAAAPRARRPRRRSASASRSGRNASYFVWRDDLARRCSGSTTRRAEDEQRRALGAGSRRSTRRSCRARRCSRRVLGLAIPDNELTATLRRQAAQDVARGPARRVPARAGRPTSRSCSCSRTATGSTRCRATCSTCSLASVARRCRVLVVLAYRPAAALGGGARGRAAAAVRRARARRARRPPTPSCSIRSQARAAVRRGRGTRRRARRARHGARAGQPVLHRGAAQLHPQPGRRSRPTSARCAALELPDSLHSLILSRDRHARRGAAAHAQGRERGRPRVPRARRCPASTRSSARPDDVDGAPRALRDARPRHARPRGRRVVPLQARRHPGGRVREHAVRDPRAAARARRRLHRARRRPTRSSSQPRPARPPLLAQRRTRRRSASTCGAPARPRRRRTRTPPRSTTSSALAPLVGDGERGRPAAASSARCSSSSATGIAPRRSSARRSRCRRAPRRRRARGRGARRRSPRSRASRAASTRRSSCSTGAAQRVRGGRRRRRRRPGAAPDRHDRAPSGASTTQARASYEESLADPRAPRRQGRAWRPALEPRHRRRVRRRLRRGARATTSGRSPLRDATRRPLGDRRLATNLGMIAVAAEATTKRRDGRSRSRCGSTARSATPGWSRSPQQPRQRDPRPRRLRAPRSGTTRTSLRAYRDYDDRWALAFLLEDIGQLAALSGDAGARVRARRRRRRAARRDRRAAGARRSRKSSTRQLAPARRALGGGAASERTRAGAR